MFRCYRFLVLRRVLYRLLVFGLVAILAPGAVAQGADESAMPSKISAFSKTSAAFDDPLSPSFDPLAITPAMEAFLEKHIDPKMQREARLRRLQQAIFDPEDGLGIVYGAHGTYSAAETFERAGGNCLSFTLLFVSLARHLGFLVHFVEVDEVTGWSRFGEVSFNHWHMFAEVELANGLVQVDFLPWEERRYRARRRIEEKRMRAHFYNNMGAQSLTRGGDMELAKVYFQRALEFDPTFMPASINLAVAERRLGQVASAETRLLSVLNQYPHNEQAASNLANLYTGQGRHEEAEKWVKRRDRFLRQNPFHHFRLGMASLGANNSQEAVTHFRRAITRQADEVVFHEQLAEAYVQLRQYRKARSSLLRALDYCTPEQEEAIEKKMRRLAMLRHNS